MVEQATDSIDQAIRAAKAAGDWQEAYRLRFQELRTQGAAEVAAVKAENRALIDREERVRTALASRRLHLLPLYPELPPAIRDRMALLRT